ncbi:MAG: outer membrane beta-barrel protein [Hyphomicrobiaceae bacterium]
MTSDADNGRPPLPGMDDRAQPRRVGPVSAGRLSLAALAGVSALALCPGPAAAMDDDSSGLTTLARRDAMDDWMKRKVYGVSTVDERTRAEIANLGLKVGPYVVLPSVTASTVYDDNLYDSPDGEVGDFRYEVAPTLMLKSDLPRGALDFMAGGRFVRFQDHEEENFADAFASLTWSLDIDHANAIGGEIGSRYTHEERYSPESPAEAREPVPSWVNEISLRFIHDAGRLALSGGVDAADVDFYDVEAFDGSIIDQDFRDNRRFGGFLRFDYRFSPGYEAFVSARIDHRDYDGGDGPGHTEMSYVGRAGINFELTPVLWMGLAGGYALTDSDASGSSTVGSTVGEASLKWLPSEVVTVTLTASRSLAETTYVNAPAIREQGLDLTIDYEIMHNLTAKLSLGYEEADFLETTRMDEIIRGRIGLDYTLNDNAVFTLSYEHRERDSSLDAYDADDNRYMAGVTLRF